MSLPLYGLVPAAGRGRRLGPLPGSKELLPVGLRPDADGPVVEVACRRLLQAFREAGVERAFVVLRDDKMDVPAYLARHLDLELALAYVVTAGTASVPESLDRAFPFVQGARVALGFPDVLFEPADAFARVLAHQEQCGADVVLGLFPCEDPTTTDMVALDARGRVERIESRPRSSDLTHNWLIAVWGPRFTEHLHRTMAQARPAGPGELQLSAVFAAALAAGLDLRGLPIAGGRYLDIGIPERYARLLREGF